MAFFVRKRKVLSMLGTQTLLGLAFFFYSYLNYVPGESRPSDKPSFDSTTPASERFHPYWRPNSKRRTQKPRLLRVQSLLTLGCQSGVNSLPVSGARQWNQSYRCIQGGGFTLPHSFLPWTNEGLSPCCAGLTGPDKPPSHNNLNTETCQLVATLERWK